MTTLDFSEIPETVLTERTDGQRMAEAVGNVEDIRYCACGCGEPLKSTAKHTYLRGHKMASIAGGASRDPEPSQPNEKRNVVLPSGKSEISKEVKQDIKDKLEFFLAMGGLTWEARDPICGAAFNDRTDKIAEKLVPIIARNPTLLKWFSSGENVSTVLDLLVVLFPVGKLVVQHHVFHSISHDEEEVEALPTNLFPV